MSVRLVSLIVALPSGWRAIMVEMAGVFDALRAVSPQPPRRISRGASTNGYGHFAPEEPRGGCPAAAATRVGVGSR